MGNTNAKVLNEAVKKISVIWDYTNVQDISDQKHYETLHTHWESELDIANYHPEFLGIRIIIKNHIGSLYWTSNIHKRESLHPG